MKHILGIVDNLVNWQEVGEYSLISNKYWTAAAVMFTVVSRTGAYAHCMFYQYLSVSVFTDAEKMGINRELKYREKKGV